MTNDINDLNYTLKHLNIISLIVLFDALCYCFDTVISIMKPLKGDSDAELFLRFAKEEWLWAYYLYLFGHCFIFEEFKHMKIINPMYCIIDINKRNDNILTIANAFADDS